MGSDSEDTARSKHARSPSSSDDEEASKSSKRHKHRHHRHHHHKHHHRRHRSKNHVDEDAEIAPPPPPPPPPMVISSAADDDVEEGEIRDGDVVVDNNAGELHREDKSDSENTGGYVDDRSDGLAAKHDVGLSKDLRANSEALGNRDTGRRDKRSASKGSIKSSGHWDSDTDEGDEAAPSIHRRSSSSESGGDRRHEVLGRRRSQSRSIIEDEAMFRRKLREQAGDDSDDERLKTSSWDVRHGSRCSTRDVDMERSTAYSGRLVGEDRHHSRDAEDKYRSKERDIEREWQRDWDWERSLDREVDRYRKREKEPDRNNERDRERERQMDRERRIDKERERSWDREVDRNRRSQRDRERSRDRDSRREDRDRSRDRELDVGRRRDREVEWRRSRERERSRDRMDLDRKRHQDSDRQVARSSERDRDWEREREKDRDRYRDRDRVRDHDGKSETDRVKRSYGNKDRARDTESNTEKGHAGYFGVSFGDRRDKLKRGEEEEDDFEERIELKLAQQEDEDLERIEESRKRRQAILEKYKNQQQQQNGSHSEPAKAAIQTDQLVSASAASVATEAPNGKIDGDDSVAEPSFSLGKSPPQNGIQDAERTSGAVALGQGTPKSEGSDEKYCDDIFGETPTRVRKLGKGDGQPIIRSGLHDNWDDAEGYYSYRFGELLDGRYEIAAAHGKGVFSTVVRAKDVKAGDGEPEEVAIKIIRNNETMNKAGQNEVQILQKLAAADPEDRRHCIRLLSHFKYRNHICLVFESLHMNLREVLKKFGRNIGLKLTAVRAYAKQLFIALKHLKNCGILHCDIKPDNILVNEAKNVLKLCDFGNAMSAGQNEITPYLVSRFYRAPEIILGLAYDYPLDIWSVGCCLYELYTGKVLFPGATNNDMLRLHMELKGPFPKKMLKKGAFVDQHFDQDLNFLATEEDPVTKRIIKRLILNVKPKDIGSVITGYPGEDAKMLLQFKDLLEKVFVLDPEKRLTVSQALAHPFVTGK